MNKLTYVLVAGVVVTLISVGALWTNAHAGMGCCGSAGNDQSAAKPCMMMMMDGMGATTKPAVDVSKLADALAAIDAAKKAVNANDSKTALAELDKARAAVVAVQEAAKPAPKFANVRCPIEGETIDPAKVTAELTREYKGQKVAFCCGMCPPKWDKLTDAEKDFKLKAASGPLLAK